MRALLVRFQINEILAFGPRWQSSLGHVHLDGEARSLQAVVFVFTNLVLLIFVNRELLWTLCQSPFSCASSRAVPGSATCQV